MTLVDFFGPTRSGTAARLDSAVWPAGARYDAEGRIVLGGVALSDVAEAFGTPARVLDEREVRQRCRAYRRTFAEAEIAYAAMALPVAAVASWITDEGLSVVARSSGELTAMLDAGVDPKRIILHAKDLPRETLANAVARQVGRIVVGSPAEIDLLAAVATRPQRVLLRVSPGIEHDLPHGVPVGFPLGDATATAIARVLGAPMLELTGLHCHLGSQIYNPDHYGEAIRRMVAEMAQARHDHDCLLTDLDLGGGHAIAYRTGDAEMNLAELSAIIEDALDAACARQHFPRPRVVLEPGRGIVARAGVTLYRVLSVKHGDGGSVCVVIDSATGTFAGAVVANRRAGGPLVTATVAGRAGDVILATDVRLPADLRPGELLAVPCSGAYQHASPRTRVIAVREGHYAQLVRREPDLLDRDAS
ncbi:diaminopimelate decarboxylase [Nocardia tenerifensis]|uniref:Diaminopimelate decarboxylase n=1 Tax=Nocardia tenerifensis TaxID=228006 RepID=A0A318JUU5_9NOCA|nr:diaminopimelate decarboxylase [Nocardia tenerifensis]PXX59704.1 diaminopimelate decarboxylase [Nocardia tenerifensis]